MALMMMMMMGGDYDDDDDDDNGNTNVDYYGDGDHRAMLIDPGSRVWGSSPHPYLKN